MNKKAKGSNAERNLIHKFWENNWACLRAAGSGSNHYDCPDIIAGNHQRKIALECKATKSKYQYFSKEEIFSLRSFSHLFGSEPFVAIKFNKQEWTFIPIKDIKETKRNYVVSRELAKEKGLFFEELIL